MLSNAYFQNCTMQYTLTVADVQICCITINVNSDCIYCAILHNMVPNCSRCIKCYMLYMRGNIQVILPKYAKKSREK